ncbi:hypothetical protein BH10PSE14_BH10PSE14_06930 [soil metagenome]
MIEFGIALLLIAAGLVVAQPVEQAISHRRHERTHIAHEVLVRAFPAPVPTPALAELVRQAEETLDADDLTRGVRDVAAVYARATPAKRRQRRA